MDLLTYVTCAIQMVQKPILSHRFCNFHTGFHPTIRTLYSYLHASTGFPSCPPAPEFFPWGRTSTLAVSHPMWEKAMLGLRDGMPHRLIVQCSTHDPQTYLLLLIVPTCSRLSCRILFFSQCMEAQADSLSAPLSFLPAGGALQMI